MAALQAEREREGGGRKWESVHATCISSQRNIIHLAVVDVESTKKVTCKQVRRMNENRQTHRTPISIHMILPYLFDELNAFN